MPKTTPPASRPPDARVRVRGPAWILGAALLVLLAVSGCRRSLLGPPPPPPMLAGANTPPDAVAAAHDPDLDADVRRLAHDDFVVRSRAAERLVAVGAPALPALGRRGDQAVVLYGREEISTTRPVIDAILETLPDPAVRHQLIEGAPVVRRSAAQALGTRDGWGSVTALIDATEDDVGVVRAAAAASLRRLTNRFFGFQAEAPPTLRAAATQRWRTWWAIEGRLEAGGGDDSEG